MSSPPQSLVEVLDLTSDREDPFVDVIDLTADEEDAHRPAHALWTRPVAYRASLTYIRSRTRDRVRLGELAAQADPQIAVLSSMTWDDDWLRHDVFPPSTKQLRVMEPTQALRSSGRVEKCTALVHGRQRNHSKYALLFGLKQLRILFPTANFTPWEWGESASVAGAPLLENAVAWIDLPRQPASHCSVATTPFLQALRYFLQQQGLPAHVLAALADYNGTCSSGMGFVYSV